MEKMTASTILFGFFLAGLSFIQITLLSMSDDIEILSSYGVRFSINVTLAILFFSALKTISM